MPACVFRSQRVWQEADFAASASLLCCLLHQPRLVIKKSDAQQSVEPEPCQSPKEKSAHPNYATRGQEG